MNVTTDVVIDKPSIFQMNGDTLYVGGSGGDNYTTIQDAINDASDSDTVYVYDDSSPYYELLVIDKSISLIGEDRNTTIIDGNYNGDVILISADMVSVSGFTIQYSEGDSNNQYCGIGICANNCIIFGNVINHNYYGILIDNSLNNIIEHNEFLYNENKAILIRESNYSIIKNNNIQNSGIELQHCRNSDIINNSISNCVINLFDCANENNIIGNSITEGSIAIQYECTNNLVKGNNISNTTIGILLHNFSDYNKITENIITNNQQGIFFLGAGNNIISNNIIYNNDQGVSFGVLGPSLNNIVTDNNIINNKYGIKFEPQNIMLSSNNVISKNNLIDNDINAYFSYTLMSLFFSKNIWNNNYYSDYKGGLFHLIPSEIMIYLWFKAPFFTIDWNPASEPYDIEV